jgi:hypothetical protein
MIVIFGDFVQSSGDFAQFSSILPNFRRKCFFFKIITSIPGVSSTRPAIGQGPGGGNDQTGNEEDSAGRQAGRPELK